MEIYDEIKTIKVLDGDVTLSNGYPVELVVDRPIRFDQIRSWQTRYSEALGMPVIFVDVIDREHPYDGGRDQGCLIKMYHPDSILVDKKWEHMHSGERPSIPYNPIVIGLWCGKNVLELVRYLAKYVTDMGMQYSAIGSMNVVALRSSRFNKHELKGAGIGVEGIKKYAYYRDLQGVMLYVHNLPFDDRSPGGFLLTTSLKKMVDKMDIYEGRHRLYHREQTDNDSASTVFFEDFEELAPALENFEYVTS